MLEEIAFWAAPSAGNKDTHARRLTFKFEGHDINGPQAAVQFIRLEYVADVDGVLSADWRIVEDVALGELHAGHIRLVVWDTSAFLKLVAAVQQGAILSQAYSGGGSSRSCSCVGTTSFGAVLRLKWRIASGSPCGSSWTQRLVKSSTVNVS